MTATDTDLIAEWAPDLIARLEAATEGGRELDEAIAEHVGWTLADKVECLWWPPEPSRENCQQAPLFTLSIDAAMTLVPEGFDYGFSFSKQHGLETWVQRPFQEGECFQGYAPESDPTDKTRALALCIAALKARALI